MRIIKKVWMTGCEPCEELTTILKDVKSTVIIESYNIKSVNAKERQDGKRILQKYSQTKVPFLVFVDVDADVEYETHSITQGLPDLDMINMYLDEEDN